MTPRALAILRQIAALEDGDENAEIVHEGRQVWIGLEQSNVATLNTLIRCTAVTRSWGDEDYEVFVINGTGRAIARRPELGDEVFAHIMSGKGPFRITDDKIELLEPPRKANV